MIDWVRDELKPGGGPMCPPALPITDWWILLLTPAPTRGSCYLASRPAQTASLSLSSPRESLWPRAGPRLLKHSILIQSANRTNSQWSGQRAESSQPLTQSHGNPATANSGHSPEPGNCPHCPPAKLANQVLKSWAFPFVLAGIKHFKGKG